VSDEVKAVLERAVDDLFSNVCDAVRDAACDGASEARHAILRAVAETEGDDVKTPLRRRSTAPPKMRLTTQRPRLGASSRTMTGSWRSSCAARRGRDDE